MHTFIQCIFKSWFPCLKVLLDLPITPCTLNFMFLFYSRTKNQTKSNQNKTNKSAGMCLHACACTGTHQNTKHRVWFGLPLLLSIGVPAQCDSWSVVNILSVTSKKLMIFHTQLYTGNCFLERGVTLCSLSFFHVRTFVK